VLLEEYQTKLRLQHDLDIARTIQQALLPAKPPECTGYDLAQFNDPADETGGDCFDFLGLGQDRWAITVADATGHGIGPALVIAECRALFRGVASCLPQELGKTVSQVNHLLSEDLSADHFVTAFFGVLDPTDHVLHYCSAGHGPLLVYRQAVGRVDLLPASDLPLGIIPDHDFAVGESIRLGLGDMLLVLTDGFFEWTNPGGEQFGTTRSIDIIRENADSPAAEIIGRLHEAVLAFAEGTSQADDLTAVVVKRLR
jgi:phosphoserine phosphatase